MSFLKRLFIGLLLTLILSSNASAKVYPDVPANHKHREAITAMSTKGIIKGYPNGEFHPEGLINRAEAVKVMAKSLYAPTVIERALDQHRQANHSYVLFPDVPIRKWFSEYVEVSFQNHVIQGYPDGTFKPSDNINFAEALKIILESYEVDFSQNRFSPNKFLIVTRGKWYEKYFTFAYEHNLINQNKVYYPGQLITRGEFVEVIHRLEEVLKNDLTAFVENRSITSDEYKITIPKLNIINIDVNFADLYNADAALETIKSGLGHYLSPPDFREKMVLFGHSSGYDWDDSEYKTILREINKLNNGDRIYINYKEKGYVYEIYRSNIIAAAQDRTIIENAQTNELALYTCWPPDSIENRYVVYGKPV